MKRNWDAPTVVSGLPNGYFRILELVRYKFRKWWMRSRACPSTRLLYSTSSHDVAYGLGDVRAFFSSIFFNYYFKIEKTI